MSWETKPHKLGRKIAENILETGRLFHQVNRKANFFRGLIRGLIEHEWICKIIEQERGCGK